MFNFPDNTNRRVIMVLNELKKSKKNTILSKKLNKKHDYRKN